VYSLKGVESKRRPTEGLEVEDWELGC